jgi:D-arabinose 1-dehydrogenase-like Zn-dependent alcohol dehydrogenase
MRIKAYGIKQKDGKAEPFNYERNVGDNEVRVKITYCTIARGDIQFISDDWGDTKFPLVPGHEIVGIVEETGSMIDMLDFSAKHHIESAVEVMSFSKMNEAIEKVRAGKVKIRLVMENQE